MTFHSNQKKNKIVEDKRKIMINTLFDKLETSEDRALLLLLVQSFKDEITDLSHG